MPLCGRNPAFANATIENGLLVRGLVGGLGRLEFNDDATTVRHLDSLSTRGDPDVFAELVLEYFEANGLHRRKVASGGYLVN